MFEVKDGIKKTDSLKTSGNRTISFAIKHDFDDDFFGYVEIPFEDLESLVIR